MIPSGQVWAGNPAKYLRDLTIEEKIALVENAKQMVELSKIYAEETDKTPREVLNDKYIHLTESNLDPMELAAMKLWEKGYPYTQEDMYEIEHRVPASGSNLFALNLPSRGLHREKDTFERSWEPLSYDTDKMSSVLKKYGVNTDMYEDAYQRFKHEPKGVEREDSRSMDHIPKDQSPWEKKYDNIRRSNPPTIS